MLTIDGDDDDGCIAAVVIVVFTVIIAVVVVAAVVWCDRHQRKDEGVGKISVHMGSCGSAVARDGICRSDSGCKQNLARPQYECHGGAA